MVLGLAPLDSPSSSVYLSLSLGLVLEGSIHIPSLGQGSQGTGTGSPAAGASDTPSSQIHDLLGALGPCYVPVHNRALGTQHPVLLQRIPALESLER